MRTKLKWRVALMLFGLPCMVQAYTFVFDPSNFKRAFDILKTQRKVLGSQVNTYKNQIEQFNVLVNNSKSLSQFQWDEVSSVIHKLVQTTDTLEQYKKEAGSLEAYLNRYQSQDFYQKSSCLNCSREALAKLKQNQLNASLAQKRANDALLKGIDLQQQNIKKESDKVKILQLQAQNAEGQKQAIQAAAQLASSQTNQLMQIRSLLVATENANATRAAAAADKEAVLAAGDERFRAGSFKKSSGKTW